MATPLPMLCQPGTYHGDRFRIAIETLHHLGAEIFSSLNSIAPVVPLWVSLSHSELRTPFTIAPVTLSLLKYPITSPKFGHLEPYRTPTNFELLSILFSPPPGLRMSIPVPNQPENVSGPGFGILKKEEIEGTSIPIDPPTDHAFVCLGDTLTRTHDQLLKSGEMHLIDQGVERKKVAYEVFYRMSNESVDHGAPPTGREMSKSEAETERDFHGNTDNIKYRVRFAEES